MTNPLLLHYIFDGKGGGENLLDKNINLFFSKKNFCWIHVDANNPIDVHNFFIKHKLEIDPIILNALLAEETRPRIEKNGDEALLILRGVNLNENELPEDMVSIRLWVTNNKIISARYRKLKAIGDIEDSIKSQKGPRNTGKFIFKVINAFFTRIEPFVLNLDEETDLIEEQILDNPDIKLR